MTGNEVWLKVALELYEKNIAKPVMWLGDDRNFEKAREVFGEDVCSMLEFVHYQERINNFQYDSENIEFFSSENYLRAKDRCIKMMDRLDLFGSFARQDREIIFNKLAIWILKKIEDSKPDALVMAEMAHSHAQYLVYEICQFKDIKIVKFNNLMLAPLLYLQDLKTGVRLKKDFDIDLSLSEKLKDNIKKYVKNVTEVDSKVFELDYMKKQKASIKPINKVNTFLKSGWKELIKEIVFQYKVAFKDEYYPYNPYKFGPITRHKIKKLRKKNLFKEQNKNKDNFLLKDKYAFFGLHFEPERTTNPDGGRFHDQALAIISLRKFLPKDFKILVKEHPSQFYHQDRGSRGRSPLFYNFIKNIKEVSFLGSEENTRDLINNAELVATISGSVALEAALLKKQSIIFGDSWFNNCPNVTTWHENLNYETFSNNNIYGKKDILDFLLKELDNYCVPGFQNISAQKTYSEFLDDNFLNQEQKGVFKLLELFFKGLN